MAPFDSVQRCEAAFVIEKNNKKCLKEKIQSNGGDTYSFKINIKSFHSPNIIILSVTIKWRLKYLISIKKAATFELKMR